MSSINLNKEYARLANGRIIEYPVKCESIKESDIEQGLVKEVTVLENSFKVDKFYRVVSKLKIIDHLPVLKNVQELKSLEELIQENYIEPLFPYFHLEKLGISTVPFNVIQDMVEAVREIGTVELNRFAQTRGYDDIISLISYKDDPFPRFAKEGQRGFELRSLYWSVFTLFNEGVVTGEIEFPRTVEGIVSMFPTLTWD